MSEFWIDVFSGDDEEQRAKMQAEMTSLSLGFVPRKYLYIFEGLYYFYVWPCVFIWYLALKEASKIIFAVVLRVRSALDESSQMSTHWDETVVPAILQLVETTMPTISSGFADGMMAVGVAFWMYAASAFCTFLDNESFGSLARSFGLLCFPLLVALDVAGASSDCDSIMRTLNDKRGKAMDSLETDAKIQHLERYLTLSNRGQG